MKLFLCQFCFNHLSISLYFLEHSQTRTGSPTVCSGRFGTGTTLPVCSSRSRSRSEPAGEAVTSTISASSGLFYIQSSAFKAVCVDVRFAQGRHAKPSLPSALPDRHGKACQQARQRHQRRKSLYFFIGCFNFLRTHVYQNDFRCIVCSTLELVQL